MREKLTTAKTTGWGRLHGEQRWRPEERWAVTDNSHLWNARRNSRHDGAAGDEPSRIPREGKQNRVGCLGVQ